MVARRWWYYRVQIVIHKPNRANWRQYIKLQGDNVLLAFFTFTVNNNPCANKIVSGLMPATIMLHLIISSTAIVVKKIAPSNCRLCLFAVHVKQRFNHTSRAHDDRHQKIDATATEHLITLAENWSSTPCTVCN